MVSVVNQQAIGQPKINIPRVDSVVLALVVKAVVLHVTYSLDDEDANCRVTKHEQ
jgi:hypothetical protein